MVGGSFLTNDMCVVTKDVIEDIKSEIVGGAPPLEACLLHGLSREDFFRLYNEGRRSSDKRCLSYKFFRMIDCATSELIIRYVRDILGDGNWRSTIWVLEKLFIDRFSFGDDSGVNDNISMVVNALSVNRENYKKLKGKK